jgi:branched-chain amino acid transport system permease protein
MATIPTTPEPQSRAVLGTMRKAFAAHRVNWIDIAIWVVAIGAYFVVPDYLSLGTTVLIMILFTLSLDLAVGYGGIDSLGQGAFFGVGGYAAAYWALHVTGEPISGLIAGAVASGILAAISGVVILRTRGLTLIMITLAISSMLEEFATTAKSITGGDDGLTGYNIHPVLGIFPFDIYFQTAYFYCMAALAVCFIISRVVVNSPFGLTVRGIRENPVRMRLLGVPIKARLIFLFTLSGAIAGVAGALSAQVTGLIGTDTLTFLVSGNALIALILGGFGRLYGAFLGAALFQIFSDRLAAAYPFHWQLGLGILLILAVRFMPNGITGLIDDATKRVSGLRGHSDS